MQEPIVLFKEGDTVLATNPMNSDLRGYYGMIMRIERDVGKLIYRVRFIGLAPSYMATRVGEGWVKRSNDKTHEYYGFKQTSLSFYPLSNRDGARALKQD